MDWKTLRYRWEWRLQSTPEALWPYVADTQRFNQAVQLPALDITELPAEHGGSYRIGRTSRFGVLIEWDELPFEWIKNREFQNTRIFSKGPLARADSRLSLTPYKSGSRLRYEVDVTPANLAGWFGALYQVGWQARRHFDRVFRNIDDAIQKRVSEPFPLKKTTISAAGRARLTDFVGRLIQSGHDQMWVDWLKTTILTEADLNLTRMRPYRLADAWEAPRREILELFLSAAKIGLLNMRWDVLCPLCRGAKSTAPALDQLQKGVHCPTCNIDFEADFTRYVELTFNPHPQIRAVHDGTYCIGGPMITPHIVVHQRLQPNELRSLTLDLEPGEYRLRTQQPGVEQWVTLQEDQAAISKQLSVYAEADAIDVIGAVAGEALSLTLTNNTDYIQNIYMERAQWYNDAVTATEVTTMQHFRDLFSDEVIRPGEDIGIHSITILFSDLVGSTAMYNTLGDAPSYALVREQFAFLQEIVRRHDGAVIKTIGDAIMAGFVNPLRGVNAALTIQKSVAEFNEAHPQHPLKIKLGLHTGPAIAVNLNGRLDYFGTTVNLAARLEGQSIGGDVVISHKVRNDPGVSALLQSRQVSVAKFRTSIKGFEDNFVLYRLMPEDPEQVEALKQTEPEAGPVPATKDMSNVEVGKRDIAISMSE